MADDIDRLVFWIVASLIGAILLGLRGEAPLTMLHIVLVPTAIGAILGFGHVWLKGRPQ